MKWKPGTLADSLGKKFTARFPQPKIRYAIIAGVCFSVLPSLIYIGTSIANSQHKPTIAPMAIREKDRIVIPENSPLRNKISIQTVKASDIPHLVNFPGIIEADPAKTVNIVSPTTGFLQDLRVTLGDPVTTGQILAAVQSPGLAQARSDLEKSQSQLLLNQEALNRARKANRAGASPFKEVEVALNNYHQAIAEKARAEAVLAALDHQHANTLLLRSPIPGRVTAVNYGQGSWIGDTASPIITVSNIQTVWVTANIPETIIGLVRKNLSADIRLPAYPAEVLHGTVSFVNSFLEPDTRRNKTRILFDNRNKKLQPNMFASVDILLPQPPTVMVPLSAILMYNDKSTVFLEVKPWTFVRREVELGYEDGNQVRIMSGLKAGDRIASCGGVLVND